MAKYTSKTISLNGSQAEIYSKLSNIGAYQQLLDKMPEDLRKKAGDVRFTDDAILINAQPVGEIRLEIIERREPELIKLQAANSPVPMYLMLQLSSASDTATDIAAAIDVDIPAMLKPMIGPKMQEAANQMSQLIERLFAGNTQQ